MTATTQHAEAKSAAHQSAHQAAPVRYRVQTNPVEAMAWDGTWDGMEAIKAAFPGMDVCSSNLHPASKTVRSWCIRTGSTSEQVHPGDYIVKAQDGSFSTCTAKFFSATYERAWTADAWVEETMRLVELVADSEHANGDTVGRVHRAFLREHLTRGPALPKQHEASLTVDAPNGDKLVAHGTKLDMLTLERVVRAAAQAKTPVDWDPDLAGLALKAHGFLKEVMTAVDRENLHDLIDQLAAKGTRTSVS